MTASFRMSRARWLLMLFAIIYTFVPANSMAMDREFVSGIRLRAIVAALPVFHRHGYPIDKYQVSVVRGEDTGEPQGTFVVVFVPLDRLVIQGKPARGSDLPAIDVLISGKNMRIIKSNIGAK
jgi:hypothetical protein